MPEAFRPTLPRLRDRLRQALPDAAEMTAYNLPGFKVGDMVAASYAAFSKQIGLHFLGPAIAQLAGEIVDAGRKASKSGVTFTPRKPVPDDLVTRLARASRMYAGT
ncbi:iron chaperone [Citricoccus sp. GCM10030269]|uniref:iron chaperone n=1 Tax=Citricoccus sp. GCM10030269 TaxID=3273388 RepID=UPI003607BCB9